MKAAYKWGILAGLAIAVAGSATIPWSFWDAGIRQQLAEQVRQATGLNTTSAKKVTIALLPRPHIKLRSVQIGDRWKNLDMDVQVLKADLRLLSLIAGRLEVSSISLYLPTITVNVHARPLHDRGAIAKASSANQSPAEIRKASSARLGAVHIFGGRILLKGSSDGPVTQIGDVNASLDWRSVGTPAELRGTMIWRGERVEVSAAVEKPADLLRSQSSPLKLALRTRLASIDLDGAISALAGGWLYQGGLTAGSSAFRALMSQIGVEWLLPGSITSLRMQGQLTLRPGSAAFSNLNMDIDGNELRGSLAVRMQEARPLITGTLAANSFSIDRRSANLPGLTTSDGAWNTATLPLRGLGQADIDLRLSAQQASFNQFRASDVAVVTLLRSGNLEISISSGKAYGGSFQARVGIEKGPAIPAVTAAVRFSDIDMDTFMRSQARSLRLTGQARGEFALRSAGSSFAEIATLVSGDAALDISNGSIAGIDLDEALRLAQTAPLTIPDRIRFGATRFNTLTIKARAKEGSIGIIEGIIASKTVRSAVGGYVKLPARQLNLTVTAVQAADKRSAEKPIALDLDIAGSWDRPSILPNPESLIMRSKAAEPLLGAIEKLRDAAARNGAANGQTNGQMNGKAATPAAAAPQ